MDNKPELPTEASAVDPTSAGTSRPVRAENEERRTHDLAPRGRATRTLPAQMAYDQFWQEQLSAQQEQISAHLATMNNLGINIRRSFAISALTRVMERLDTGLHGLDQIKQESNEFVQRTIDSSPLRETIAQATALLDSSIVRQTTDALDQYASVLNDISTKFNSVLTGIDVGLVFETFERHIPSNLRGVHDLNAVASLALDEGIPLCWVPRAEVVTALIDAEGPTERQRVLTERRSDILDDCESALSQIHHEWSIQCSQAIKALRKGQYGPAQSHASNIIDSIVITGPGRTTAVERARDEFDDLPLYLIAENLVLRPLVRALARWFPDSGDPPPMHFARHVTSHGVGHTGVFDTLYALIGIMLATSLIVQYAPLMRDDQDADGALGHRS